MRPSGSRPARRSRARLRSAVGASVVAVAIAGAVGVGGASGSGAPEATAAKRLVPIKRINEKFKDKGDYKCDDSDKVYPGPAFADEGRDVEKVTFKLNRNKVQMTIKTDRNFRIYNEGEKDELIGIADPAMRMYVNPGRAERKWSTFNYNPGEERIGYPGYITLSTRGDTNGDNDEETGLFLAQAETPPEESGAIHYDVLTKVKASLSSKDSELTVKFPLKGLKKALPRKEKLRGMAFGFYTACEVSVDASGYRHFTGDLAPGPTLTIKRRSGPLFNDIEVGGKLAYVKLAKTKKKK